MQELHKIVEKAKEIEAKLEKLQNEKKMLETTNEDLSKRMNELEELKAKFGVKNEEQDPPLGTEELEEYKETLKDFKEMVRKNIKGPTELITEATAQQLKRDVTLRVPERFNLSKVFHDWYDKFEENKFCPKDDYAFLFCDLSSVDHLATVAINLNKITGRWNIIFDGTRTSLFLFCYVSCCTCTACSSLPIFLHNLFFLIVAS